MTWTLWIVAIVLAGAGLALLVHSIIGDRAKGRRRCPKCWYDASGLGSRACPECGHEAKDEREMLRTHRRPSRFLAASALLVGAIASASTPIFLDPSWHAKAPLWVLSSVVLVSDDTNGRLLGELQARAGGDLAKLSAVGRWLHARRAASIYASDVRSIKAVSARADRMLMVIVGANSSGAIGPLRRMLDHPDDAVRYAGLTCIVKIHARAGASVVELARAAEHDPSDACRTAAFRALGKIGPKARSALPMLERMARGDDADMAALAVQAFDGVADDPVPVLAELLSSATPEARIECARALGRRGEPARAAADTLLESMSADAADLRHESMAALLRVDPGHAGFAGAVALATRDENRSIRYGAIQNLEVLASMRPIEPDAFLGALDDTELSIRFAAAQAISRLWPASPASVRGAEVMLKEQDRGVRLWGVQRLREWGRASFAALPALRSVRWDEYEPLRAEAAAAIREIEQGRPGG